MVQLIKLPEGIEWDGKMSANYRSAAGEMRSGCEHRKVGPWRPFTSEFKGPHPIGVPLRGGMCRTYQIHLVLEGVQFL